MKYNEKIHISAKDRSEIALRLSLAMIGTSGNAIPANLTPANVMGKYAANLFNSIYCNLCLPYDISQEIIRDIEYEHKQR